MATQLYRTLTGQSQTSHKSSEESSSAHPVRPTITRTTTTGTLVGVLNHLTEAQAVKLDEFKKVLTKEGWWTPHGLNGKPSHDDGTLLRYLRARKFDVNGAYGQFTDTEKWFKEQRVEELYENFDVEHYERARLMYPQWTGHRDRRGIPIYVYHIKGLDSKNVSRYQKDSQQYKDSLPNHKKLATPAKLLPLFALYHNLLNFVLPMVSTLERPHPEVPVTNSTNIVDITGVGLTQFWNLKNHMQDASVLATAHYPETLDRIFIIGAPAFFPTVWGWIKRWFDPVTVSKIFILAKHEVRPTLEKFMHPKDFPKRFGGELEWDWGQLPDLDEETRAALEKDGHSGWVRGPALWLDHQRVVVGSENGKLRRNPKEIEKLKPVVYAADGTDEPVHPDAIVGEKMVNGAPTAPATLAPAAAGTLMTTEVQETTPEPVPQSNPEADLPATNTDTSAAAATMTSNSSDINPSNIRNAPDGAPVNLPDHQPGFPEQTAEYLSSSQIAKMNGTAHRPQSSSQPAPNSISEETTTAKSTTASPHPPPAASITQPLTNGTSSNTSTSSSASPPPASHPPSQPLPGPKSAHEQALTKAIAGKLEGESVSIIPAADPTVNGHVNSGASGDIPHPEIIVASDRSKGLAVEADKVDGARPGMERFVTAVEVPASGK